LTFGAPNLTHINAGIVGLVANVVVAGAAQLILPASRRPAQDREPASEPAFEESR
jgi:hypothetical protein